MRRCDGQGTIEYVGILAVVAVLLTLAGAVAGAPGLANAVGRSVRHALCRVGAGTCAVVDPAPCTVRATTLKGGFSAKVAVLRVGRDSAIVRTERSDGTIDVTLLDDGRIGAVAALGAKGRLQLGGTTIGAGAAAEATLLATLGGGRTWRVHRAKEADDLVHRLALRIAARGASALPVIGALVDIGERVAHRGAHGDLPTPDSSIVTTGIAAEAKALLGPLEGATGKLAGVIGRKRSHDGSTTWLLRVSGEVAKPLSWAVGLTNTGSGEVGLALTYDRHHHLQRLDVTATGTKDRRGTLERGAWTPQVRVGHKVQVAAALDLTDDDNAALVTAVLRTLRSGAVAALARAVADRAAIDVSVYHEDREGLGVDLTAGLGAGVGVDVELSRAGSVLEGAWSRPPGGAWERRLDCRA